MPKTAAQRAARKRRRQAKKARMRGGTSQVRAMPTKQKKSRRNKSRLVRSNPLGPNQLSIRSIGGQKLGKTRGSSNFSLGSLATSRFRQVIEEDEYIAEINGSVGFATTAFPINPGQSGTFPWGNKIAQLYEKYEFEFLEFYLCSEVSAYASQGQTGVVILSCDYDASDVAPTTKQQVLDTDPHTVPCLPSVEAPIILPLDPAEMRNGLGKYVRPGSQPANTDIKTYDSGTLYVSTQGQGGTGNIGELHVRYRCHLKKPVLESAINLQGAAVHFSGTAATTANNFATAALQSGGSPVLNGVTLGANVINFPAGIPGNYVFVLGVQGATSASALAYSSQTGGVTFTSLFTQGGVRNAVSSMDSLAATTTSNAILVQSFTLPSVVSSITISPSTIVGTGSMDLMIFALPTTLVTLTEKLTYDELHDEVMELKSFMELMRRQPALQLQAERSDSEAEAPDECKEPELSRSVHIPRSMAAKLSSLMTGGK